MQFWFVSKNQLLFFNNELEPATAEEQKEITSMFENGDYVKVVIGYYKSKIGQKVGYRNGLNKIMVEGCDERGCFYFDQELEPATAEEIHSYRLQTEGNSICLK